MIAALCQQAPAWHRAPMLEAAASKPHRAVPLSYVAIAGTVITWAAAFPAIAIALTEVSPLSMAAARFAIAACSAAAWLAWRKPPRMSVHDYALAAVCGVLGTAIYGVLLNLGQLTVSAGAASFIVNTQPVLMAGMASLFLKERLSTWAWLGTALGFLGVALIAQGQPGGLEFGA